MFAKTGHLMFNKRRVKEDIFSNEEDHTFSLHEHLNCTQVIE